MFVVILPLHTPAANLKLLGLLGLPYQLGL
jgi:hypothetical protein